MATTNTTIDTGLWIDWSSGRVVGATVTLSARDGAILISFITVLLSFAGNQFWKILVYILHQTWYANEHVDSLKHQQRAILRNSVNPGSAAWSFTQQWLSWRRTWRILPLVLLAVMYFVAAAALSVFAPAKLHATPYRLISPVNCGYWFAEDETANIAKGLAMSQAGSVFSQECYETPNPQSQKCQEYPILQTLPTRDAPCPFANDYCWTKNTSVPFSITTKKLNSRDDLGINIHESLSYRSELTCTIMDDTHEGIQEYLDGQGSGGLADLIRLHWGNVTDTSGPRNHTYSYSTLARTINVPYTLDIVTASPGSNGLWTPIDPLNRTDADVTMILFAANAVTSKKMIDDPLFSSHTPRVLTRLDNSTIDTGRYDFDWITATIGCTEQYQLCTDEKCSAMLSLNQAFSNNIAEELDLSPAQKAIKARLYYAAVFSNLIQVIGQRSGNALRATQTLATNVQWNSMPDDQYLTEFASWYTTSLSMFEAALWSYVDGDGSNVLFPDTTDIEKEMCHLQRTSNTTGTQAFSVVRIVLIVCICVLTILVSFVLEPCMKLIQQYLIPSRRTAAALWGMDESLQLQRHLFEALDYGKWYDSPWLPVPTNSSAQPFGIVDTTDQGKPRFVEHGDSSPVVGYKSEFGKPVVSVTANEAGY